jgi:hypothetical protein
MHLKKYPVQLDLNTFCRNTEIGQKCAFIHDSISCMTERLPLAQTCPLGGASE